MFDQIRQRKLVQWVVAYGAGAWMVFEAVGALSETWLWPPVVGQIAFLVLVSGLGAVIVLSWFHGEKGRQRVSGVEGVMLTLVAVAGAGSISVVVSDSKSSPAAEAAPSPTGATHSERSILVLPFSDLSPEGGRAYLGDGIAETLINGLGRIEELRVVARTSAFAFRDSGLDVREIARRVEAGTVLEGSVTQIGDRIRITANLFEASSGLDLWSQRFDRETDAAELFDLQDEVAQAILDALAVELDTRGRVVRDGTANQDAQRAYFLGQHHWTARTTEDMILAARYFHEAIAADSAYADAWSGLALSYALHTPSEYAVPGFSLRRGTELSLDAARRALEIDPEQEAAYTALGDAMMQRGRLDEAEGYFRRAIELNPGYATAHHWLGDLLMLSLRGEEALPEMEIAESLSPVAPAILVEKAAALMMLGRTDEALAQMDMAAEILPDAMLVQQFAVFFGAAAGDWDRAGQSLRRFGELAGTPPRLAAVMASALQDPERRSQMLHAWRDGPADLLPPEISESVRVMSRPEIRFIAARHLGGDGAALDILEEMARGPGRDAIYGPVLPALMGPELSGTTRARDLLRLAYSRD
jgi:TolB-like protein/Tfp pilus assembly protein PilF